LSSHRPGARRRLEGTLPAVAAGDPRSYDLPDFRTLDDGPYPAILLEAMERAGAPLCRRDTGRPPGVRLADPTPWASRRATHTAAQFPLWIRPVIGGYRPDPGKACSVRVLLQRRPAAGPRRGECPAGRHRVLLRGGRPHPAGGAGNSPGASSLGQLLPPGADCPGGGGARRPVGRLLSWRLGLMGRHRVANRRTSAAHLCALPCSLIAFAS
jgi:hypothetical protein